MDSKRLEEIRAAAALATPGPWRAQGELVFPPSGRAVARTVSVGEHVSGRNSHANVARRRANSELLAAAPELLAEVQRLRGEAAELWDGRHLGRCGGNMNSEWQCLRCQARNPYRSAK